MSYLLDTNILLRLSDPNSAEYADVIAALNRIAVLGRRPYITAQNLIEFRAVVTRPATSNGLGWSAVQADQRVLTLSRFFDFLPDTPTIYTTWLHLVQITATTGKNVHDARLAAVAIAHGVNSILTLNTRDFQRFTQHGLAVVEPQNV